MQRSTLTYRAEADRGQRTEFNWAKIRGLIRRTPDFDGILAAHCAVELTHWEPDVSPGARKGAVVASDIHRRNVRFSFEAPNSGVLCSSFQAADEPPVPAPMLGGAS